MSTDIVRLAVIVGSVREGRFAPVVSRWFQGRLTGLPNVTTDMIDLADVDLPTNHDGGGDTQDFVARIDAADAFVVVTPEYNHGYPGYLKIAIDSALDEWKFKPVGFVSYGGTAGGLRAVEQLRLVFAELQVVTVRRSVSFANAHSQFDAEGLLTTPNQANDAVQSMLDQLLWWDAFLRSSRRGPSARG